MSESLSGQERTPNVVDAADEGGGERRRRLPRSTLWAVAASCLVVFSGLPPLHADDARGELTYAELTDSVASEVAIVDNAWFLPVDDSGPPAHQLEGTLTVPRGEMQRSSYEFATYRYFPGFSIDFVTVDDHIVPADRSIITNPGDWSLILSPGRIWSEPGDNGLSRASFPFTLGSPPDRLFSGGEAHNGIAAFLFDDTTVSSFRFQITQETAPDGDIYDMWGQLPMEYESGAVTDGAEIQRAFSEELAAQLLIAEWSTLEAQSDSDVLASFTEGLDPEEISAAGIVVDGVVYLQPSQTRSGEFPYPRFMQHAGMSVSKSIGAGVAMLWLAQKYGEEVFDLRIVDYLDVTADHEGWAEVTFGDVLNMATGVGDNSPNRMPYDIDANESGPNYRRFYLGETTHEKLGAAFAAGNYSWGPNEIARYTSSQTFVLSAAMDAFIKTKEGPGADLWERLTDEVFHPIGIHHMTMMHVPAGEGQRGTPLMASGLRLTVDDLGKITTLLQNGGTHDGEQLLHPERTADALYRSGELTGLPTGKSFADGDQAYHASFWSIAHRAKSGSYFQVPFMSGAGGNTVFLAPNGVSTFVFTDSGQDSYSLNSPAVAEAIRPYPEPGLPSVSLMSEGFGAGGRAAVVALAAMLLTATGLVVWLILRRRRTATQPGT
jgi:hypothetical protein